MMDAGSGTSPEVSVVIASFQTREFTRTCLASLERHAGVDYETIVVDDGSSDGTAQAVREEFPRARLIAKARHAGLVPARNTALAHVRGRFVIMLDSDTEVRPGALRTLASVLDRDPGIGLVGPRLVNPDGTLQLSSRRYPPLLVPFVRRGPYARFIDDDPPMHRRHLMKDFDHASERPVVWVAGAAQMWRADLPSRIGTYDTHLRSIGYGEDLDWCLRVWEADMRVHYVPQAEVMHHRQHVTRQQLYGRESFRALYTWYYLQWKHRALRRNPRLAEASR